MLVFPFHSTHFYYFFDNSDTPQFRGGNPYFFRENPYQSVSFIYASMYSENVHAIHTIPVYYQFTKNRDIAANNQNWSFRSLGATVGLGLRLWLTTGQSSSTGDEISVFLKFTEKASCVDDKNCFVSLHIIHKLFFSILPQIRITMWYGRIISKKAKIRIGYGQSVPGGMSAIADINY